MNLQQFTKSNNTMKKKILITAFAFLIVFFGTLLSDKYIGNGKTYGKPLSWEKIQERIPSYIFASTAIAFIVFYSVHKKEK